MGSHPLNLALAFLLELAAMASMIYWGWTQHEGIWRLVWAIGLPFVVAVIWGVFRVDNDPGKAPIRIPGFLRLLLELTVYAIAVIALAAAEQRTTAAIFGIVVLVHYVTSYDHVLWLLRQ
jgi:hypothetical protein